MIFLFKYIPNSGYNPNVLANYDEDLYFAKQVIVNACATQAILAILLNNEDKIELGQELLDLKNFTKLMDPYMKGLSISNCEKIREEHNKFSRPEPFVFTGKKEAGDKDDVFHFVAYFHFKNQVYEIDGLREGPILIADNVNNQSWIKAVQPSILNRINLYANNEIKFNLLAMIPDRKNKIESRLEDLEKRKEFILNFIKSPGEIKDV
jgi:ubiquitin carboxyl-terminal hydrolase L5